MKVGDRVRITATDLPELYLKHGTVIPGWETPGPDGLWVKVDGEAQHAMLRLRDVEIVDA